MVGYSRRSPLRASILPTLILLSTSLSAHSALGQSPYLNTLDSFSDAAQPLAALIQGSGGDLYGTGQYGGTNNTGSVFSISPGGTFTTLYNFSAQNASLVNADGANPASSLIQVTAGNLYGTASSGGKYRNGTIFMISPAGKLKTLHSFSAENTSHGNSDGANPAAGLIQARDGNFYGTCQFGGANGAGTIFKITVSGTFTTLFSFNSLVNGGQPLAGLVQASDGAFYGTTSEGGDGGGTLFRITPSGKFSVLRYFTTEKPAACLVQGSDGALYGTDQLGGVDGVGEVFKITMVGVFTSLHSFSAVDSEGDNSDGILPAAGLIQARDGAFYGTASAGGAFNYGTIFRMMLDGTFTTFYNFGNQSDGASPFAGLIQGNDGSFYGTCSAGGTSGNGTVFQLNPSGYGIIALSPSHVSAPAASTLLTVTGNGFIGGAVILFGNTALATTVVNSTTLTAAIPAAGLAQPGNALVSIMQSRAISNSQPFAVVSHPILTLLKPSFVVAFAPATLLKVTGSGFAGGAVILFGNVALATTVVNSTTLTATIPAASLAQPANVPVSVGQSGVLSSHLIFAVDSQPVLTLQPYHLSRAINGNVETAFYVADTGSSPASGVTITASTLAAQNTITKLPTKLGTIAAGATTALAHLVFPGSVGTKGQQATLTISGTYQGGTYTASATVTLP